ncbi:MAG TPA: TonB-dependent receptor, partial [Polyangia bacterium]
AGDEMPYVPRHQLNASLGLESDRFGVLGEVTYVNAMRERAGQGDDPAEPKTDSSVIANAGARVRVAGPVWAYLQLRNVFNATDIASRRPFGARPTAPRWLQLGIKAGF